MTRHLLHFTDKTSAIVEVFARFVCSSIRFHPLFHSTLDPFFLVVITHYSTSLSKYIVVCCRGSIGNKIDQVSFVHPRCSCLRED